MRVTHFECVGVELNMTSQTSMKCLVGTLALLAASGCGPAVFGSGKGVAVTKEVPAFTRLSVAGAIAVTTTEGPLSVLTLTSAQCRSASNTFSPRGDRR